MMRSDVNGNWFLFYRVGGGNFQVLSTNVTWVHYDDDLNVFIARDGTVYLF